VRLSQEHIQNDVVLLDDLTGIATYLDEDWSNSNNVGCVQANRGLQVLPWGKACFVSYFEMEVVDEGEYGYVTIGLAFFGYPLRRAQPGWQHKSIAYHGERGWFYPFLIIDLF